MSLSSTNWFKLRLVQCFPPRLQSVPAEMLFFLKVVRVCVLQLVISTVVNSTYVGCLLCCCVIIIIIIIVIFFFMMREEGPQAHEFLSA